MTSTKTHLMGLSLALVLGACSSTPMATSTAPAPAAPPAAPAALPAPAAPAPAAPSAAPASTVKTVTLPPYLDPQSELSRARSVFFDFDETRLRPEYGALVEQHGKYLASHPGVAIRVEGNTDERGSAEYNLALGQKRAQAVLQALKVFGVRDSQVEAISWGEEKPRASGHAEAAWAQNRRADLQYPTK